MYYTGKVLHKETGKPLCGVPVSDGRNTVLTDEKGCYALPGWERTHTVWVGMLTCVHDDWYCFTNGKPGNYDFAISPWERDRLELLHISDTEISEDKDVEWVGFLAEQAGKTKPAFLIHTGDITRREGILLHRQVMNYETMGCPVRFVIGNHDYAQETDTTATYGEQPFEEEAGPVWNSFDCAGVHCVVLSFGRGSSGDMASGYKKADQWAWLKNDLDTVGMGKPLVIFEHSAGPDPYEFQMGELDLKQYNLLAWIYGHSHMNLHHIRSGVHNICTGRAHTGGIDASPAGIRKITIEAGRVCSEMIHRRFPVAAPDKPLWHTKLPGNVLYCEPVIQGDDLLVGTMCESLPSESGLSCLDRATGNVKWTFTVKGNGVMNNFAVDNDLVYCQDTMGYLYCLDSSTGKEVWKKELMLGGTGRTKCSVVVSDDLVIGGKSMKVFALDKATGDLCWTCTAMKKGEQSAARTVYVKNHGYLIVNAQWGTLICIDAKTGEAIWQRNDHPLWYRNGTPCVDGDYLYTGGFDMLHKLDIHTGQTLMEMDMGAAAKALGAPTVESDGDMNVCGAPIVDGDVLYCPTATGGVVAVDKNSMKALRRFPTGAAALLTAPYVKQGAQMVESRPVILGDQLLFTAMDGKLYIYNKHTAELIKSVNMPAPSLVAPIVVDDGIYTVDFDGNICKFQL